MPSRNWPGPEAGQSEIRQTIFKQDVRRGLGERATMAAVLNPASRTSENRETGWVNRLFSREEFTPEYQVAASMNRRRWWTHGFPTDRA